MANRKQVKQKYSRNPMKIGEYKDYDQCRFCTQKGIVSIIDFDNVPLAGGFIKKGATKKDFGKERLYPLNTCFCPTCSLVQVREVIDPEVLFKKYFYFSSTIKTLVEHFSHFADELQEMYKDKRGKRTIVEIGSNDGVFMRPLIEKGFNVIGVDPATNVVKPLIRKGLNVINDCFTENVGKQIRKKYGKVDAIVSSYSFAHIDDMHDVMRGIDEILKPDGILIFEVYYLGIMIDEIQYDMIYHEHHSYYSLSALQYFFNMYDMEVYDVTTTPLRAGTKRFFIQRKRKGKNRISRNVEKLEREEKAKKLNKLSTLQGYSSYIKKTKEDLLSIIKKAKKNKKTVVGYGASGRATMIMTYCGITSEHLDYVMDDSPVKHGAYTPGNHLRITNSDILDHPKKKPDYCVVFAWPFINEILKKKINYLKNGGIFIVPLPKVAQLTSKDVK